MMYRMCLGRKKSGEKIFFLSCTKMEEGKLSAVVLPLRVLQQGHYVLIGVCWEEIDSKMREKVGSNYTQKNQRELKEKTRRFVFDSVVKKFDKNIRLGVYFFQSFHQGNCMAP